MLKSSRKVLVLVLGPQVLVHVLVLEPYVLVLVKLSSNLKSLTTSLVSCIMLVQRLRKYARPWMAVWLSVTALRTSMKLLCVELG